MFIHQEDGAEVEMKITGDGTLVVHCPKCNKLWADTFDLIDVSAAQRDVAAFMGKVNISEAMKSKPEIQFKRLGTIMSARKAYPNLFQ